MAIINNTIKEGKLTQKTASDTLVTLHPETSADQVIESTNKKFVTSSEKTKLSSIASGAQVNVLEGIKKADGTELTITNKKVTLPDYLLKSEKGAQNGVATLDSQGKILLSQIPDMVLGQVQFGGILVMNGSSVSELLPSSALKVLYGSDSITFEQLINAVKSNSTKYSGLYLIVSGSAVNVTLNAGIVGTVTNVSVGDWIVFLGGHTTTSNSITDVGIGKIDNSDAVMMVNEKIGNVWLDASNIFTDNTKTKTILTALNEKSPVANPNFTGTPTINNKDIATKDYVDSAVSAGTASGADKLTTSRKITSTGDATGSYNFDGSKDVSYTLTLSNTGVTAGTYSAVKVDAKGRVTQGQQFIKVITSLSDSIADVAIGGFVFVENS